MLTESLYERLSWFEDGLCIDTDGSFVIKETKKGGEGEVTCHPRSQVIAFNGLEGKNFYSLTNKKCADGIIFEKSGEDSWRLHIVELKSTISNGDWHTAKEQFAGAILHAHALIGLLGIPKIDEIKCYIAYRKDELRPREVNPAAYKQQLGHSARKAAHIEWSQATKIKLLSLEVDYIKVPMNRETKTGELTLT